jgi:hypothetical protein
MYSKRQRFGLRGGTPCICAGHWYVDGHDGTRRHSRYLLRTHRLQGKGLGSHGPVRPVMRPMLSGRKPHGSARIYLVAIEG